MSPDEAGGTVGGARAGDTVRLFEDPLALAEGVADFVAAELEKAVARAGVASLVLSGGSTPERSYERLATRRVDWKRVDVFWGDERCVPPEARASNYRMARISLLEPAGVPPERIHRIEGDDGALPAAERYEGLLRARYTGKRPEFDVVLLGVGTDGHVASLFPAAAPSPVGSWAVPVERPAPDVDRVSLTLDALCGARRLLVLAAGAEKAPIVAHARVGEDASLPVVQLLQRAPGAIWFLDRAAAGKETR